MRRSFKFQLRPTAKQAIALGQMLTDHRALYNAALQERRDAYRHPSKTTVRYGDQSAQLKAIRGTDPDQARWVFGGQHGAPVAQANAHARAARNRHRARKGRPVREAPDDATPPPRRPRARTGGAGGGGGGGGWAPPRPAPTRGKDGRYQPAGQPGDRDPLDDELADLDDVRPDDEQNPDETEQDPADDGLPDVDLTDLEPAGNDR